MILPSSITKGENLTLDLNLSQAVMCSLHEFSCTLTRQTEKQKENEVNRRVLIKSDQLHISVLSYKYQKFPISSSTSPDSVQNN